MRLKAFKTWIIVLLLSQMISSKDDQKPTPPDQLFEEEYLAKFTKKNLKAEDKSIFKVIDLFQKFPDVGAIPQCGSVKCQNLMIGNHTNFSNVCD